MLSVTVQKQFGDFTLDAAWSSDQPIVALVGPSGSGKTLTLQCIAGLIAPDEKTFEYVKGRPRAPKGEAFDMAHRADSR